MRIFIAAILPREIKKYLGKYILDIKGFVNGVKWEIPEKLHITLKFIGSIDESKLDKIGIALSGYEYSEKSVRMKISGIDGFPNFIKPRVIVVKLEYSDVLNEIRNYVETSLSQIGIEYDSRNFIPHVTIGRVKSNFKIKKDLPAIDTQEFKLVSLEVVNSVLSKSGSDYFTCFKFNLG